MGLNDTTATKLSLKRLSGKAMTSGEKGVANEALPSNVVISAQTIFGNIVPPNPVNSFYTITDGNAEYLRLSASFIAGSDTSDGRHAFSLHLPDDYESNSSNPKAGTYPFVNKQSIPITSGSLQLIPTSFGNAYEAKAYHTGSGQTQIPVLDARDWVIDYFSGIFFQQDPPGSGDQTTNPRYVDAYLYVGDFLIASTGSGGGGGSGGGDPDAQYLVLAATGSLSAERILTMGTGLSSQDAGSGGNYTLSVKDSIFAALTGSQFSGNVGVTGSIGSTSLVTSPAFSGSLTHLQDGSSYLIAGSGISITSASNGAITIANDGTVGDITSVIAGTGLSGGGTSGAVTLNIKDTIVATLSGSQFSGNVGITGSLGVTAGISGSITHLSDGTSYLIAGDNTTITTGSNGAVTIASTNTTYSAGDGLDLTGTVFSTDLKSAGGLKIEATELAIDNSIVATLTGSVFTGDVVMKENLTVSGSLTALEFHTLLVSSSIIYSSGSTKFGDSSSDTHIFTGSATFSTGLSGSLTHLADGTSYIVAGAGITVTSASNGSITITNDGTDGDITSVTAGTGLTGGGSSGGVTLNIDDNVVATLTGSQFSGNVGITGSFGATSNSIFGNNSSLSGVDNHFFVSGAINSRGTSTRGTAVFGGDVVLSGTLSVNRAQAGVGSFVTITSDGKVGIGSDTPAYKLSVGGNMDVGEYIYHKNDANTYVRFQEDQIHIKAGGRSMIKMKEDTSDQVLILSGAGGATSPDPAGFTDANFFVSGTIGSIGTSNPGTSVFGGDMVVSGNLVVRNGLSGSLTKLHDGSSYLVAGSGITITSASNGGITIANDGTVGDITSVTAGTGLLGGGSSGAVTLNIDDNIVATLTGSQFSGNVGITGSFGVQGDVEVTEYIKHIGDGDTFIQFADDAIGITAGGEQLITISEAGQDIVKIGDGGDVDFQVRTLGDDNTLYVKGDTDRIGIGTNAPSSILHIKESAPTLTLQRENNSNASTINFLGQNGNAANSIIHDSSTNDLVFKTFNGSTVEEILRLGDHYGVPNRQVIFLSGSRMHDGAMQPRDCTDIAFFVSGSTGSRNSSTLGTAVFGGDTVVSGALVALSGVSGSLTHLSDGSSYLIAGDNTTITTGSSGAVTIAATNTTYSAGDGLDLSGTIFSADLKAAGGLKIDSTELAVDDNVVATISGSTFTGAVSFNSGLSGSLTQLVDGTPYLVAGSGVSITTGSNGQITFTATGAGSGDITGVIAGDGLSGGGSSGTVSLSTAPSSSLYFVTSSHNPSEPLTVPGANFARNAYDYEKTQIFVNGIYMMSGSSLDYSLAGNADQIIFNFELRNDDIVLVKYI